VLRAVFLDAATLGEARFALWRIEGADGSSPVFTSDVVGVRLDQAAELCNLVALVPPGRWPATLPTTSKASLDPKPVALGIGERVCALLPEAEHAAFHEAIRHFTLTRFYLSALACDGAVRWSDDGKRALGPVSEEHRASATAALLSRALRELKQQRPPKQAGGWPRRGRALPPTGARPSPGSRPSWRSPSSGWDSGVSLR
jgi:hypothetical protein